MSRLVSIPAGAVEAGLTDAVSAGLVVSSATGSTRWSLSEQGRRHVERLLSIEIDRLGVRSELNDCYRRFRVMNDQVLAVCTAWQVITVGSTVITNDHSDADHDSSVLRRFEDLHRSVVPFVHRLGELSPRFAGYDGRLTMAHDRISAGDTRWLTRPTVDSYHSIWFELHENLLANLGRERSDEPDE